MHIDIRELADADAEASRQLRHEAFGSRISGEAAVPRKGSHWIGAYDGDRLVARFADREYESWWGGATLPTAGLAGVTIGQEERGSGVLKPLFDAGVRAAKERGAVVATMYPTAVGIYRSLGFERIADMMNVKLTMQNLMSVRRPAGVTLRRATVADIPVLRDLYEQWACQHNGPLVRSGPHFRRDDAAVLKAYTGITIAEDEQGPCGYASWDRSSGHTPESYIAVSDLVSLRSEAAAALLAMFATNEPVLGFIKLDVSFPDPVQMALSSNQLDVLERDIYGLKVLDVQRAFEMRTWAPALRTRLDFELVGDRLEENNGAWRLEVADGHATCTRLGASDSGLTRFTSRGLAVTWAGAQTVGSARAAELVTGPRDDDASWNAVLGGREVHVRDYF